MIVIARIARQAAALATFAGVFGAVVAAPQAATAATSASALQTVRLAYTYSGHGSAVLSVSGSTRTAPGAVFATVTVDQPDSPHANAFFPDVTDLDATSTHTYGAAGDHNLCGGPVTCSMTGGTFGFFDEFTIEGSGDPITEYIVIRGIDVKVHNLVLQGWTVRRSTSGLQRLTDIDAGGLGIDHDGTSAGLNTGATAPGPARGSIAIAVPGCDVVGAGVLTLSGGTTPATGVCPGGAVAALAAGRTTWKASGAVVGASMNSTRLLVISR